MQKFWHKQGNRALFPDLLWSRPENKNQAGKLLIVGGNQYGFVEPSEAFTAAEAAGIGVARMVLPDSLSPYVGKIFTAGELAPSTPSGSLSQQALGMLLQQADWADGVLLAGGLGRNSETAILLEKFTDKYRGQLTITKDAADYFTAAPQKILARPETTFVVSLAQLQKLSAHANFTRAFTFSMDLIRLVEALHEFTEKFEVNIIVKHLENLLVAVDGQVSSTPLRQGSEGQAKLDEKSAIWRVETAAHAAVWWLQNPSKPFEALTTAAHEASKN